MRLTEAYEQARPNKPLPAQSSSDEVAARLDKFMETLAALPANATVATLRDALRGVAMTDKARRNPPNPQK